jgi:vacuole morphology and inheritance protein 14
MATPTPSAAQPPASPQVEIIPLAVARLLSDRSFDKRKAGAQEVEKLMRRLQADKPTSRKTLVYLVQEFALSPNSNNRKGGLIALASAAIGLSSSISEHLDLLVPAVMKSFSDPEARVRYYACESLFNITKICRGSMLGFFGDIFVGVCKLVADQDPGASLRILRVSGALAS